MSFSTYQNGDPTNPNRRVRADVSTFVMQQKEGEAPEATQIREQIYVYINTGGLRRTEQLT